MSKAEDVAKEIHDACCLGNATVEEVARVLTQFAKERLGQEKQIWNKRCNEACEKQVLKQYNAALEEAAKIAEFHSGPSIQLAEKIRAQKRG